MRNFHRLHLLFLIITPYHGDSPVFYSLPCRNQVTPIRSIFCRRFCHAGNGQDLKEYTFGGGGRNRTAVQNTFQLPSTN